jgi:hypothetical protein
VNVSGLTAGNGRPVTRIEDPGTLTWNAYVVFAFLDGCWRGIAAYVEVLTFSLFAFAGGGRPNSLTRGSRKSNGFCAMFPRRTRVLTRFARHLHWIDIFCHKCRTATSVPVRQRPTI